MGQAIDNYDKNMKGDPYDRDDEDGVAIDKEPLTDGEILSTLSQAVNDADDWNTSNLSAQRVDAYDMYYGAFPRQRTIGRSGYVSLDVLDVTESLKASVLNVFAGERNPVQFEAFGSVDQKEVEQANLTMDYILNNQNDQYKIHSDVVFDGLLTKIGVVKCYHEQVQSFVDFPFSGTREQLDMILGQDDDIDLKTERSAENVEGISQDEFGNTFATDMEMVEAILTRRYEEDCIRVDVIPPEEFLVDERARDVEDAVFTCHQRDVTIGELREMGFDEELIEEIGSGDQIPHLSTDYERVARNQYDNKGSFSTNVPIADESMAYQTLYESYLIADYDGDGYPHMCQVFHCNNVVLEKTRVDTNPFHAFVPFPISHKLHGQSVSDRIGGIQVYKTQLERAILDNTELNNNTRYIANVEALKNPRELSDTRFGGVVRAKGNPSNVVMELTKPTLSPHTFDAIKILEDEKQQRTGVNKMTQGLSEDALKPGNAASKVNEVMNVSFQRQKIVARQYASFWKKVYEHVYQLAVAYLPHLAVPNPSGEPIVVRPNTWRSTRVAVINDALAFGEAEQKANQLMQIDRMLASDPNAANMYTQEDRYNMWTQIFDNLGYAVPFVTAPDPNKPTPVQQQQMQMQQKQLAAAQMANQIAQQQLQLQMADRQLKAQKQGHDARMDQQNLALNTDKYELDARSNADDTNTDQQKIDIDRRYKADMVALDQEQLELDKRKVAIEALLEAQQKRGVDIG